MALFDSVVNEAREKFDLGDKAQDLLSALLSLISNRNLGGFAGFLQRFTDAGLGDTASSWINTDANTPLSYEQLESALGENTLRDISRNAGLDYQKTVSASAFMIPHIVDKLSPTGFAPDEADLSAQIGSYLRDVGGTTVGETFDRIGTAATATIDAESRAAGENLEIVDEAEENTALNWLLPVIILGLLVAAGFMFCGKSEPAEKPVSINANQTNLNANIQVNVNR